MRNKLILPSAFFLLGCLASAVIAFLVWPRESDPAPPADVLAPLRNLVAIVADDL